MTGENDSNIKGVEHNGMRTMKQQEKIKRNNKQRSKELRELRELRHKNIQRVEELSSHTSNAYSKGDITISDTNDDNNIGVENGDDYDEETTSGVFSNNRPITVLNVEHEPDDEFERRQNDIFSELRGRNLTKGVWKNLVNHNE